MAGKFSPPREILFSGNLRENWLRWKKEFGFYLTATEGNSKPDAVKILSLLTALGEKGREVYYTFIFTDDIEAMKYDTVLQKFDAYKNINHNKNITYLRYLFFSCNQFQGQNIDDLVTELKFRAAHCEFQTLKYSLSKDKLVIRVNDKTVKELLLREEDLEKVIQICKAAEEIKEQSHEINNGASSSSKSSIQVDKIGHKYTHKSSKSMKSGQKSSKSSYIKNCKFCRQGHNYRQCAACNKTCRNCHKGNHFKAGCKAGKAKSVKYIIVENSSSQSESEDEREFKS